MTRKRRRLVLIGLAMLGLGSATALALTAFQDNLLFFYSPTDLTAEQPGPDRLFRLGGLVEQNSVQRIGDGTTIAFTVTDMVHQVPVVYSGLLPDLFREGQGVVAQGRLRPDGTFEAVEVLAKHDENYMPPEVAKALRASGEWRDQGSAAPGAAQ